MIAMGFASNVVYMVILAAIETMVLVVVMNLRRFRGKSDSVFYGYALGLGISCGLSTGIVFVTASTVETFDASVVVLILISVSMSLMLGACGTTVGEGIARHRVMEFALQAMIPLIIYNIILTVLLQGGEMGGMVAYYVCAVRRRALLPHDDAPSPADRQGGPQDGGQEARRPSEVIRPCRRPPSLPR